jgi:hypothetical protein
MEKSVILAAFATGLSIGLSISLVSVLFSCPKRKSSAPSCSETTISVSQSSERSSSKMAVLEKQFRITTDKLHDIVKHFNHELSKGLKSPGQTIKALPSFVFMFSFTCKILLVSRLQSCQLGKKLALSWLWTWVGLICVFVKLFWKDTESFAFVRKSLPFLNR